MVDADGRRYLDAYNNVPVVGHSHPRVVDAIARQGRLLNTNMRYLHGAAVELAERLLATTPPEIDTCVFVNSGSEANELAWRILTATTGRGGGVVTEHAYHGVTTATAALSPEEWADQAPPAHVARIPAPDTYRGGTLDWGAQATIPLGDAFGALRERGFEPGAVVIDSGYTSDGVFAPAAAYLQGSSTLRTPRCGLRRRRGPGGSRPHRRASLELYRERRRPRRGHARQADGQRPSGRRGPPARRHCRRDGRAHDVLLDLRRQPGRLRRRARRPRRDRGGAARRERPRRRRVSARELAALAADHERDRRRPRARPADRGGARLRSR